LVARPLIHICKSQKKTNQGGRQERVADAGLRKAKRLRFAGLNRKAHRVTRSKSGEEKEANSNLKRAQSGQKRNRKETEKTGQQGLRGGATKKTGNQDGEQSAKAPDRCRLKPRNQEKR